MNKLGKQKCSQIVDADYGGDKDRQFKGVRLRKWGKWVSEVRIPNCRAKIWLGSYDTAEQAARAFDAAAFCLRGFHANLNFPDTVPAIPSPSSLSRRQIQQAAAKYARGQIASACKNSNDVMVELEKPLSPPISSSSTVQQMETSFDSLLMSEKPEFEFWESLFGHSECNQLLNLDNLPSLDVD